MRIPTLDNNQVDLQPLPTVRKAYLQNTVGESIGQGLSHAGSVIGDIQAQEKQKADNAAVIEADTTMSQVSNSLLYDPESGAMNKQKKDAFNLPAQTLPQYDKSVTDVANGLTSNRAKRIFLQTAGQRRAQLEGTLNQHESKQRDAYYDQVDNDAIVQSRSTASLNSGNPQIVQSELDNQAAIARQHAKRTGQDEQVVINATHAGTFKDLIDRSLTDGKINQAEAYLAQGKDVFTGEQALQMHKTIEATRREMEAEGRRQQSQAWADLAPRIQNTSAAYLHGDNVPDAPTFAEIKAARPDDAKEIWDSLQKDQQQGKDIKAFSVMTPTEIQKSVDAHKESLTSRNAADALARQSTIEQAARMSIAQRVADPAQFVVDNNLGWGQLGHNVDEALNELDKRKATRVDVSKQLGVDVPLLSKHEASAMAAVLEDQDPKAALGIYAKLKNVLGEDYISVMQQIAPDSPVKAHAGAMAANDEQLQTTHWFKKDEFMPSKKVAEYMLKGEELINPTKAAKKEDGKPKVSLFLPETKSLQREFSTVVGHAYQDASDVAEQDFQAVKAYYVGKAAIAGELSKDNQDINHNLVVEAVHNVVGNIVNYNGQGEVTIPWGMDVNTFRDRAHIAINHQIEAGNLDPAIVGQNVGLLRDHGGKYQLVIKNTPIAGLKTHDKVLIDISSPMVVGKKPIVMGRGVTGSQDIIE